MYYLAIEEESETDTRRVWWYWNKRKGITPYENEATLFDDINKLFDEFYKNENGARFTLEMLKEGRIFFNTFILTKEIKE